MDWKNKKALVTGGAGFIGSHLSTKLVDLGSDVTVIDLIKKSSTINLEEIKDKIKIIDVDIANREDFNKLENDYEYIFHLGAIGQPRACQENPDLAFKVNVTGTLNVLGFAANNNIKKFIFASSSLLYGEPKYLPIDEKHPIDISNNVYSLTKKIGEDLCEHYNETFGLPIVYLRQSNMFGPKQAIDYIIPTIIVQAIKTKRIEVWNTEFVRDFTFISDTVSAFLKASESNFKGGPINITSGTKVKIGDMASRVANYTGSMLVSLNKELSSPLEIHCTNELAKKLLEWSPQISFEAGLKLTFDWYTKNIDRF